MNEKIYWGDNHSIIEWDGNSMDYIRVFCFPKKWWSLKAWKLAFKLVPLITISKQDK